MIGAWLAVAALAEPPPEPGPPAEEAALPPVLLREVTPDYPDEARQHRIRGDVIVRIQIDEAGAVEHVDLVHPVHPLLDLPSMEAARQMRFAPATRGGVPVATSIDYRFHFDYALVDEQQGATAPGSLYGRIEDTEGLPIPRARITLVPPPDSGASPRTLEAGDDGRFAAPFLPPGTWEVRIVTEFAPDAIFSVEVTAGQAVQITFPVSTADSEIVVYGQRKTWREVARGELLPDTSSVTGSYTLTRRDIESTPGSLEDAARAVQALPGVVGDPDLLASFNVRGGETGDVVFLLDRVPLDNPFHLAGFNSLFNPDMLKEIHFYAGAPPADVPAGTSAVMSVDSWDGAPRTDAHDLDGAFDISASSARALVMGPLTRDESLTVALAARRTYLEGYLQVLKWANIVDTAFAAPEYSELSGRLALRRGEHRLMLTALRAGDSLALVDSDDASLVDFDGRFELRNLLHLLSADHTWTPSERTTWRTTAAFTVDRSFLARDLGGVTERTYRTARGYARSDLDAHLDGVRLQAGVDGAVTDLSAEGEIEDPRAVPNWANTGITDLGQPLVSLGNIPAYGDASAYGQVVLDLEPAQIRTGLRARYAGATSELLWSPSAGASFPLPTGTIPKVAFGLYQRPPRDPVVLDPELGNPDIGSEHSAQLVFGVDQGFPLPGSEAGGLLRIEAYTIARSRLVVHPDTLDAALTARAPYQNVGTGRDRGLDVMIAARSGRWGSVTTWGLLFSDRDNPLGGAYGTAIAPTQDQRHTFGTSLEWQLSGRWRTTARYTFHTGRPVSTLVAGGPDFAALGCLNCRRLGPTHDLALRAEWRKAYDRYLLSLYFEILNAPNFRSPFTPIASVAPIETTGGGTEPLGTLDVSTLYHLPVRPFLGIRADF